VHNGLLLSALWDAAFDTGLVSFADDGTVLASPDLSLADAEMRERSSFAERLRRAGGSHYAGRHLYPADAPGG
jgi:hypothetical protein